MNEIIPKFVRPQTNTAAHKVAVALIDRESMSMDDACAYFDQNARRQHKVDILLSWACRGTFFIDCDKIRLTDRARKFYDLSGFADLPVVDLVQPRQYNVFAAPTVGSIPKLNPYGSRDDVPEWSKREYRAITLTGGA